MPAKLTVKEIADKCQTVEQIDAMLEQLDKLDYEDSLYGFLRAAWKHIDPSPWADGWAIEAMAEHLQAVADGEIKRLLINVPPRFGKSSLCSVAFPAWVWAQPKKRWGPNCGPQVQFLHASYAEKLSLRDSVKCRRLIQSPWYQRLWGDRFALSSDQNVKSRFSNDKGGERLITSIGAGVTGEGGSVGIIDDANSAAEVTSEASIQSTNDWWDQAMSTRLNDPKTGAFIGVQQRLAETDWTGHVLSKDRGEWVHLCLPMRFEPERSFVTSIGWKDPRTEPGELLMPDRFGEEEVAALESALGSWGSAGQLQQRPEPAGGGIIKRDFWVLWEDEKFPAMDYIVASLDTAFTEKKLNDPSAMTVWGVFHGSHTAQASRVLGPDGRPMDVGRAYQEGSPKVVLMNAWNEHLEFHALVEKAVTTCRKLGVDRLLIEAKANGISVEQEIRRLYTNENFAVQLVNPGSLDKTARLISVQHLFEKKIIYAPDRSWADMVITQAAQVPKGRFKDLVDTVSQALKHLRECGFLNTPEERIEELEGARQFAGRPPEPLYPA